MLPAILGLIPVLIGAAEKVFPGEKGEVKKVFVTQVLESLYDKVVSKIVPDVPGFDEKRFFLAVCSAAIDDAVAQILKK